MAEVLVMDSLLNRAEFLAARKTRLGSSDIAAIAGLDSYRTPIGVWMEKKGYSDGIEENDAMWFGTAMEPLVAQRYSELNNIKVERDQKMYTRAEYPWACATPDYFIPSTGQILEIKTTEMDWDKGLPERVSVQVTWQMGIMGAKSCIVAALGRGRRLVSTEVEFDQGLFDGLIALGQNFVDKHLVTEIPPPPLKAIDSDLLAEFYKGNEGETIDLSKTPGVLALIEQWDCDRAVYETNMLEAKEFKEHMKVSEASIRALMKDARMAICGTRVVTIKEVERKAYQVKPSKYQTFTIK